MATIKSYSDLQQSKKLAEILPLESADMYYTLEDFVDKDTGDVFSIEKVSLGTPSEKEIGCWSLASLLGVLPLVDFTTPQLIGTPKTLYRCIYNDGLKSHAYDNPVDACYEMILKLHELKLL